MYSFLQVSSRKDLQQQKMDCSWHPKKKKKITGTDLPTQRKRVLKGQHAPKRILFKTGFKIGGGGVGVSWHNFRCFLKETVWYKNVHLDKSFVKLWVCIKNRKSREESSIQISHILSKWFKNCKNLKFQIKSFDLRNKHYHIKLPNVTSSKDL